MLVSAFLLVTASPILGRPVPGLGAMPVGTLVSWIGIVALPLAIYSGLGGLHPPRRATDCVMNAVMKALLILAVAWVPICYALSGNLAFTFESNSGFRGSETALFYFFYGTIAQVIAPILVMLVYGIVRFFGRVRVAER